MKVLIDTNVILDVLCNRPDFLENSLKIWKLFLILFTFSGKNLHLKKLWKSFQDL